MQELEEISRVTSPEFANALIADLSRMPKAVKPKWLYDRRGSELFDQICETKDYYVTRTERSILGDIAPLLAEFMGTGAKIYEPGAGAVDKIELLLDALERPKIYVPTDISEEHLLENAALLERRFPRLKVQPMACDFTKNLALPEGFQEGGPVTIFFPGSTIGNFEPEDAHMILERFARVPNVRWLIIGVDVPKNEERLLRAYDDSEGATAAFNLNLLRRANREADANFDVTAFRHHVRFDKALSRVEMHLESKKRQVVRVADREFEFEAGETIHTECSYKYESGHFLDIARQAGWKQEMFWTDAESLFSVRLFLRA